ncbi:MAG: hypothetical protein U0975_09980 [Erythrobacter sp.]|nr:hypothetical protein [Erythrobacter sp.]MDZ4272990.1 hypothetical protein [Erythrobacter sp.]
MAERLGEALLELRTNDAGFTAGVTQAELRANKLGGTLDKTKGSSAQLAGEMTRTGQSASRLTSGLSGASRSTEQLGQAGVRATVGIERLRAAQELAAQAGISSARPFRGAIWGYNRPLPPPG